MSVLIQGSQLRALLLGVRVERAADTLPQTTDEAIFTVSGGRVIITSLYGEVTTAIGAGTTPELKVKFNPTGTGADTDLSAATNIASDAVGTTYATTGDYSTVLSQGLWTVEGALQTPYMVSEGDIEIDMDESVTGAIQWTLTYIPLDDGASVAATAV